VGFEPFLLAFRTRRRQGWVSRTPQLLDPSGRALDPRLVRGFRRWGPPIFVIHGYGKTWALGEEMVSSELELLVPRLPAGPRRPVFGVIWPSDQGLGLLRMVRFRRSDDAGVASGPALARFIERHTSGSPSFFGQSLGARVVLETLSRLHAHGQRSDRVLLTAAAVEGDSFRNDVYGPAVRSARKVGVLHSTADGVLRLAFPVARRWRRATDDPTALGLEGPSSPVPQTVEEERAAGWGHTQYMPQHDQDPPHREIARVAAAFLAAGRLEAPDPRVLP